MDSTRWKLHYDVAMVFTTIYVHIYDVLWSRHLVYLLLCSLSALFPFTPHITNKPLFTFSYTTANLVTRQDSSIESTLMYFSQMLPVLLVGRAQCTWQGYLLYYFLFISQVNVLPLSNGTGQIYGTYLKHDGELMKS